MNHIFSPNASTHQAQRLHRDFGRQCYDDAGPSQTHDADASNIHNGSVNSQPIQLEDCGNFDLNEIPPYLEDDV